MLTKSPFLVQIVQRYRECCFALLGLVVSLGSAPGARGQWVQAAGPYGGNVSCFAQNGSNLFVGTQNNTGSGGVYRSTDDGTTWRSVCSGLPNTTVNALVASGANLIAATNGGVSLSTDNGTHWSAAISGMTVSPVSAFLVAGRTLLAGGDVGSTQTEQFGFDNLCVDIACDPPPCDCCMDSTKNGKGRPSKR